MHPTDALTVPTRTSLAVWQADDGGSHSRRDVTHRRDALFDEHRISGAPPSAYPSAIVVPTSPHALSTRHRRCFCRLQILRDAELTVTNFHDLLSLLCPDFQLRVVKSAFKAAWVVLRGELSTLQHSVAHRIYCCIPCHHWRAQCLMCVHDPIA